MNPPITAAGARVRDRAVDRAARAYAGAAMAPTRERDGHSQHEMVVRAVRDLGEGVRRLTFGAPELRDFVRAGADEYLGLLMPPRGRHLVMPQAGRRDVRAAVAEIDEGERPDLRWYTLRAHRPEVGEIDVDIVTHGDSGPGSAWARRARAGDTVGFRSGGALYRGDEVAGAQLLVVDETAVPALLAVLDDRATRGLTGDLRVHVEVPRAEVAAALGVPAGTGGVTVHERGGGTPGSAVLAALVGGVQASDTEHLDYAWLCGESGLVTGLRRHLVTARRMERRRVLFSGYWRRGAARP